MIYNFLLVTILLYISFIDIKTFRIPNKSVLLILALSLFMISIKCYNERTISYLIDGLLGLIAGGLPLAIIIIISNGGIGAGDMKLLAVLGLFFGAKQILCITVMAIVGMGIVALFLVVLRLKSTKSNMPMAPFIMLSCLAMLIFKEQIFMALNYYYKI